MAGNENTSEMDKLKNKLQNLQRAYGKARAELNRKSVKSPQKVITSLAYSEEYGLTLERTHVADKLLHEDPKRLLGTEYNAVLKPMVFMIALSNRAINGIPLDERHKVFNQDASGRPIKDSPALDAEGKQKYSTSLLDKLKHDLDILIKDPNFTKAISSLTDAMAAHREEFLSPELKTDQPYVKAVKSVASRPRKSEVSFDR
jgi:hypothetical protein